ncbi:MAG: flippase-like domain-containing protein [Saprospiraceae bacterium]|nr:flippase-like domain-containing protein [Saprospiraceae bacterium]
MTFSSIIKSIKAFFARQPAYVSVLIKVLIVCLFSFLLWKEVFKRENLTEMHALFLKNWASEKRIWLVLVVVFVPINWAAETLKWWHLVRLTEPISFWKAYKAVLAGVTFSLFMPNRVGEFGGRILFLKPENAVKGILSTLVGSLAQQIVLLTCGFAGAGYVFSTFWQIDPLILRGVLFVGCVLMVLIFFLFLNLEIFIPLLKKIRILYRFPRLIKQVNVVRRYAKKDLLRTLFWAAARYGIYGIQYFWAVSFFGIKVPFLMASASIATIYLLQTSVPLPPFLSVIARGELALKIWGITSGSPTDNSLNILAATFLIWIINLIFPAFIGLIFLLNINYFKKK